jgi:hypothetical protein
MPGKLIAQQAGSVRGSGWEAKRRAESMEAEQSPRQAGKAQAVITSLVCAVTRPGGKDIDWERVGAVGSMIGAVTVILGLRTRQWRYMRTAATVLAIGSAVAGRLKDKYAGASPAAESK